MGIYTRDFLEISIDDVEEVGGKNASLGEMYRTLTPLGVKIPDGFAVTASAYRYFLNYNSLHERLHELLDGLDYDDVELLQKRGEACREAILDAPLPEDLRREILLGYSRLVERYGDGLTLAVRSSATAEDSPEASFAGQNDTYLAIRGEDALLDAYRRCLASNFTDRSLHYKYDNGFDWSEVYLSVTVMKMVRSDIGASGVMFSIDTETGFEDVIFINSTWGLGENVVQGSVDPDSFYIHKPTFAKGYRAVLKRRLGSKELKMVVDDTVDIAGPAVEYTKNIVTDENERSRFSLSDDDLMVLADYAIKVENHYSEMAGHRKAMDMEWAKDGEDGQIYMVQARPETIHSKRVGPTVEIYHLKERGEVLVTGRAVGTKIGGGRVRLVEDVDNLHEFQKGDVLVAHTTTPDWEPVMKIASAIVTERGGRTCHAAIVSRELGIPAIVGAKDAMEILENGQEVTLSCAEGETGYLYGGRLEYWVETLDPGTVSRSETEIMMNLGNPERAFSLSSLPVDGIGLARMEFIVNEYIKAHPMAIVHPERLDRESLAEIEKLSAPFVSAKEFFIKSLSEGVATIASSVYPRPCVVRMSDFKSNEYASLLGGRFFEPEEDNPMIGFRGASRYSHPAYEEGFELECLAMKRAREVIGMENIVLMIPFCRRVEEAKRVVETMRRYGLERGRDGLKIYMMCEIPSNVIEIDEFSEIFDGFSIGSNDLTQLTLGVDRDSEIVSFDYDERDPAVLKMIEMAVEGASRNGRHSGICGEAPSDYPEIAEFLVRIGIDSISLNPDTVIDTKKRIVEIERELGV
jgi:pyruvate,water dikinase